MRKLPSSLHTALILGTGTLAFHAGEARATANKFDVGIGYYSVSAKTSTGSGSTSGPGLYQLNFRRTIAPRIELAIGYTIYFSSFVSGDSGSGLDIGANYFPFTLTGPAESSAPGAKIILEEIWRPYVGGTFNQRNFQSVQSTYTGFGIVAGCERTLTETTNLNANVRYIQLSGPKGSTGTEMDIAAGLGFKF